MKSLISVVLVLSLATASWAAAAIGDFNNPKYPGKCYISENLILPPGEIKDPNTDCGRIICGSNGFATFHTCGTQSIHFEGFKLGGYEDKSLPYPQCCKRKIVPVSVKTSQSKL